MTDIAQDNWSENDDQNAENVPLGFPPGLPAGIEQIGRAMMGAIKRSWRRENPFYVTTGTGDNYVITPQSPQSVINIYEYITARANRSNTTTSPTLKYGNATVRNIKKITASGKINVEIGDIVNDKDHTFWFDGVDYVLSNPSVGNAISTAAKNGQWTQSGAGAVLSTIDTKLKEAPLDIRDFGAKCDNVTDDTNAIKAAVAEAASRSVGGIVFIPPGTSVISDEIVVPDGRPPVLFLGAGQGMSVIRQTTVGKRGIVFDDTNYYTTGGGVRDLSIECGAGFVTSNFLGDGGGTIGIYARRQARGFQIVGVGVHNFQNGIQLIGCFNTENIDVQVQYFSGTGILIDSVPTEGPSSGNSFSGGFVSNYLFSGVNTASIGLRVRRTGGEWFENFDVTCPNIGVQIDPRSGEQVNYLWFRQVLADTCLTAGWLFDGTLGPIYRTDLSDCWGSYTSGNGWSLQGNIYGFRATNIGARENINYGFAILSSGVQFVELVNPDFNANSRGTAYAASGFTAVTGISDLTIIGGSIGNHESSTLQQGDGIVLQGTATRAIIQGVNLVSPGTGKKGMNYTESLMNDCSFSGNVPKDKGNNLSDRISLAGGTFLATAATSYVGTNGGASGPGQFPFRQIGLWRITNVTIISNTAFGTENVTGTVFKNGASAGVSLTITGASTFSASASTNINLASLDGFEMQLVSSAAAAGAIINVIFQIEPSY